MRASMEHHPKMSIAKRACSSNQIFFFFIGAFAVGVLLHSHRLHQSLQGLIHEHQRELSELDAKCTMCDCSRAAPSLVYRMSRITAAPDQPEENALLDGPSSQQYDPLRQLPHLIPPTPQKNEIKQRLKALFRTMPRLENLPKNSTVFLTFTNGHYSELMLNSLATIAVMGLPAFAYCFDSVAVQLCHELGIPYLHPEHGRMMESSDFRQNRAKFLEMGVHKPEMVERLFHEYHVYQVILTDTDTVWLRDPRPYLAGYPATDVFTTTDCNSHVAETYFLPDYRRCAHTTPGQARASWGINTGITVYRNHPKTIPFLRAWRDVMLDPASLQRQFDDQASFMHVLATTSPAMNFPNATFHRGPLDPHVFFAGPTGSLKTVVLPSILFPGGKTFFDYHLSEKYGTHPYAIHATFQRYNNPGKRSRFREAGAWLLDDSSYYSAGKFLSVSNNVFSFIQSVQHSTNAEISLLHIQLLAAAYQHAILRDAYAIAKALKRILILPPLYSWCDWEPDSNVLLTCVAKHNEGQVPYQGPSDLYVNIEVMDSAKYIEYREHTFLSHPSVARSVLWDKETVYFYWPQERLPVRYAAGVNIVMDGNLTDKSLQERLGQYQSCKQLYLENLEPHAFAGFVSEQENHEFERFHSGMRWEQKWCCHTTNYTHKLAGHQHIFYVQPTPLTQKPRLPWRIPQYTWPDYCNLSHHMPLTVKDEPGSREIWRSPNHPCLYFRPGMAPQLPTEWTRNVSLLQLPVDRGHRWPPFERPGDAAPWLQSRIARNGSGVA